MGKTTDPATIEAKKNELAELEKKVSALRKEIKVLEEKPQTTPNYEYAVNVVDLTKLCNRQIAISGIKDLFDKVLTIKDPDGKEVKLEQYSVRVRNEGLRIIREYCVLEKKSPRIFYIKSIKSERMRQANRVKNDKDIEMIDADIKLLDKQIELSERKRKLLESNQKYAEVKNGNTGD